MKAIDTLGDGEDLVGKEKEFYVSPQLEMMEIKVERGFAASPVGGGGSGVSDWGTGTW